MKALLRLWRHPSRLWLPLLFHHVLTKLKHSYTLHCTKYRVTYHQNKTGRLHTCFSPPPSDLVITNYPWLAEVSQLYLLHRFDWLGLGWRSVGYDTISSGLAGIRFTPASQIIDISGEWLTSAVSVHNLPEAQSLWRKISPGYMSVDWQRDHRSGYRWDMSKPSIKLKLYPELGADIKQPWELARLQHLPLLGLAFICAKNEHSGFNAPDQYVDEFKNILHDFLATNPPKFGANWMCSMDVGIRIVNILVANDLFTAGGASFDEHFQALMVRTTHEHAEHIRNHLERRPDFRANHYLANIAGLLFCAFYLGHKDAGRDMWLFASHEMKQEVMRQFYPDGTNFEASIAYHRLSGEIAIWSLALISRVEGPQAIHHELLTRLNGIGEFIRTCSRSDGTAPPIGDLDNGRFLKVSSDYFKPAVSADALLKSESLWHENLESHQHLALAVDCFFEKEIPNSVETFFLRQLLKCTYTRPSLPLQSPIEDQLLILEQLQKVGSQSQQYAWSLPGDDFPALFAYPYFGLYIVRAKRWLLTIRCGSNGQEGNGGHAHNDQLSITLEVDGRQLIDDAGMPLYNAIPDIRQAYRSVSAHFSPQIFGVEPADIGLDPFRLPTTGEGRCLNFSSNGFAGTHNGFGFCVVRKITWTDGQLLITDYAEKNILANLLESPFHLDESYWSASVPAIASYGQIPHNYFAVK